MKRILIYVLFCWTCRSYAQTTIKETSKYSKPVSFTAAQDHDNMLMQLGIQKLRPGPSGNESAPNHANYDEAIANPCPQLPDILTLNNGKKVIAANIWWQQRRPELLETFEKEVYGRIPKNVPKVTWTVKVVDRELVNRIPVIAKELLGHVDNSSYPLIDVDIKAVLVIPANLKGPVPILIMFGKPALPAPAQPSPDDLQKINSSFKEMMIKSDPSVKEIFEKYPAYQPITKLPAPNFFAPPKADEELTREERLLASGWGYITLDPESIQADNGAGLTKGIIGLCNIGQPRKPEDWGALRAWSWGAARMLDYLETDSLVDAKKVGIEGVSRYGKAALVTLAFESRFAVGLIGSSGKGGAALHRRNFGEAVESLTGTGEYHWMAGNYLKYGTEESSFGKKTGCDLPVDSHELIALCAPRLTFISYGIPEKGDAKWLDQPGSYMATVAAGVVFKLLGTKDIGVTNDYMNEKMPPVLSGLLDGQLAWRQHDGGHTDAPNMQTFIIWTSKMLNYQKVIK
ncbi:MAG: hypothetical protein ABJA78_13915 [Ferruginibacter sp.]